MVFGMFGKKEEEEEELEPVSFLGPVNGQDVNMKANGRLVEAGLMRAKDLVTDALARRSDTIRLEPRGPQAVITISVDGIPYPGGKLGKAEGLAITQMLKLLAGLDIKERKKAQSGGIKAEFETKPYTLGIKIVPVAEGERLIVRVTDAKLKLDLPPDVGMGEPMRLKLRDLCTSPGVLLVAGPGGSGTTTTLFAVLRNIDAYMNTIYTLADFEGRKVPQVTRMEDAEPEDLAGTIAKAARREANVILCEPVKTDTAAKAMFSRHESILMMAEIPAKDTASAVLQLIEWVGDPKLVAEGLKGIVTQKLIRVLCNDCRMAYKPKSDFLRKLGLPDDIAALYRKPPDAAEGNQDQCESCGSVGFFGRTGMFELLEMTEGMQAVIAGKPDANAIRSQMKKDKMITLQQDGLRLVAEGKTSLEELQRVFKPA
ncbi:MAG: Flp pilus assembly complex ATPase component TadA [Planctomycetia bacterium]|nr:Flp pilus assembly complex ATPase component TadA [Planctomycetia bacterium]